MSRRPAPRVLVAAALAAGAGGCVYLPTINGEPDAAIERVSTGPVTVSDTVPVVLSASESTDPDGSDDLKAQWRAIWCNDDAATDCPPVNEIDLQDGAVWQEFSFFVERRRPIRVTLTVEDSRGATDSDELVIDVVNRDPDLAVQLQGYRPSGGDAFVAATPIDVVADGSDVDGDPVDFAWALFPPTGSTAAAWAPAPGFDHAYRLVPDVAGLYTVLVTATDGAGGSTEQTVPVLVAADAPPCLGTLAPITGGVHPVDRDGGPWTAAVATVIDDLDFWPPSPLEPGDPGYYDFLGETRFAWQVASPDTGGELVPVGGLGAPAYQLDPSVFAPGDLVQIRVEIADQVVRTLPCPADQPTCSISGDACLQRVTWEVEIR